MKIPLFLAALSLAAVSGTPLSFTPAQCEGFYPMHLQGICADKEAIYWCFTTQLVKTDLSGKLLKKVPVANHHGDLCFHDGKVYRRREPRQVQRSEGQRRFLGLRLRRQ